MSLTFVGRGLVLTQSLPPLARQGPDNLPDYQRYVYNAAGMLGFENAVASGEIENGGVDILFIGDSNTEGANGVSNRFSSAVNRTRKKIQQGYNPSGVPGGLGFMPIVATTAEGPDSQAGVWTDIQSSTTPPFYYDKDFANGTQLAHAQDNNRTAGKGLSITASATTVGTTNNTFGWTIDPAETFEGSNAGNGVTDLEVVWDSRNGFESPWAYIVPSASGLTNWPATEAGFLSFGRADAGTVPRTGVSNGTTYYGTRNKLAFTFDPATKYVVQITAQQFVTSTFSGVIHYNGDFNQGIRFHKFAFYGSQMSSLMGDAARRDVHLERWSRRNFAKGGAQNARLAFFCHNHNDYSLTPTAFYTVLKASVQRAKALGITPVIVAQWPANNPTIRSNWRDPFLKQSMYKVADEEGVPLLDLDLAFALDEDYEVTFTSDDAAMPPAAAQTDAGLQSLDTVHRKDEGYEYESDKFFQLIRTGIRRGKLRAGIAVA